MHTAETRIGVITLANREWEERMMTAAQLMTRLSDRYRVIWVSPSHHWRGTEERILDSTPVFRTLEGHPNLTIYTPPAWLPHTYRPAFAGRWLRARRLRQARNHLRGLGCEQIVLYLWRPRFVDALDLVEHDTSIYHIVDEYSFSADDPPTPPEERRLIDAVDELIVHSPGLIEKKGRRGRTTFIPNGVDYEAYAAPREEPEDLAGIPRPRIGYSGYVKRQLDWELIEALIERHPGYSWVFVGALLHEDLRRRLNTLASRPNVHFLGAKPSHELAGYPQHFDVCIMPYVRDPYTQYIFPLKLFEYLASGRPAVGTPIRSLQDFDQVIGLAEGPEEWSAAITAALEPEATAPEHVAERQDLARCHDWGILALRAEQLIESALEQKRDAG